MLIIFKHIKVADLKIAVLEGQSRLFLLLGINCLRKYVLFLISDFSVL